MARESKIPETKIALVTGASRGIGRAIALELGRAGMVVVGTATTPEGAEKISTLFQEQQIQGQGMALNVCDDASVKTVLADIQQHFGPLSILVNNAGITRDNLMLRMKAEEWADVIETNLTSAFRLTKAAVRPMLKARYGRIVNITSVVGVMGGPGQTNYAAAKAGLIGFTKSLALEFASAGITVNAVAPGFIKTDMTAALDEKQHEGILSMIPMSRMGSAEEIAKSVKFLTDDAAAYITGQTLHVNGGMCMV